MANRSQIRRPRGAPAATGTSVAATALTADEFEDRVRKLSAPLLGLALRLTRNRDDAEDVLQDAIYRAFRSLGSYRRGTNFRAWLSRILHNAFLNRIRRSSRSPVVADPHTLSPPSRAPANQGLQSLAEFDDLADRHLDDRTKQALAALKERYRVPFLLFALGDLSYQEIARRLQIPVGTVMSRLHRARAKLRETLAPRKPAMARTR